MPPIRLLLVDDQAIIREGLANLLGAQPGMTVVGDADNGQRAIERVQALYQTPQQPDIVLMDVRMPQVDGVAATEHICGSFPEVKVLVLTTFDDDEYVQQAMRYGAKGYLLKQTPIAELAIAIQSVHRGCTYMGPGLFEKTILPHSADALPPTAIAELSPREQDVLGLISQGYSNREIAQALFISERTVRNHVTRILSQLQLRDRTQAALFARGSLPHGRSV
ncbi:MAG: response regulator transcription factor [Cyanobacteria bacterium P01_A01_bin.135]